MYVTILQVHDLGKLDIRKEAYLVQNTNKTVQIASYTSKVMSTGSKAGLQISPRQSCLQETERKRLDCL